MAAVRLIRDGALSAEEYAGALIAQAERLRDLNALIAFNPEAVLAAARAVDERRGRGEPLGRLAGLPLLVKDNIDTRALPTTGGTPALRGHRPGRDAPVLGPLFEAGALLFGKANLHELAFGITNNNAAFGPARNPYDPRMIPGGSSGGTGAGVAARICPAGLGTDTGGSVRVPAALCGVVGLRPTTGRYRTEAIVPISHTRDTPGPIALTVADVALLDAVETGTPLAKAVDLGGLRLGVPRGPFWPDLDPETSAVMQDALARLRGLGIELVEADLPGTMARDQEAGFPIALYEANQDIPAYLAAEGNPVGFDQLQQQIASPDVAAAIAAARSGQTNQAAYERALNVVRPGMQRLYADWFRAHRVAAMVFPTTPLPARPIGQDQTVELNGRQVDTFTTFIRNTDPGSIVGLPGLSLPAGLTPSGLPVGLELDGPAGSDGLVLGIGLALEQSAFPPLPPPDVAG
jgi:indoleacetamide hydrolase